MSSTSYAIRTFNGDFLGGDVRSGLVADAKADLILQHPLEPNQAYANLSVDVMRTEKGDITGTTLQLEKITISAVITADVIEYGKVPTNYVLPSQQRSLGTLNMNDSQTNNFESNVRERKSRIKTSDFRVGDKVQFELDGEIIEGVIKDIQTTNGTARVNYRFNKRNQEGFLFLKDLSKL
jgi:hypothetical protein